VIRTEGNPSRDEAAAFTIEHLAQRRGTQAVEVRDPGCTHPRAPKVLFVFAKARRDYLIQFREGRAPRDFFYGMFDLAELGVSCRYVETGTRRLAGWGALRLIHLLFARATGLGFNLQQSLLSLRSRGGCNIMFATTDSVGMPLAMLKACGLVKMPLVYATIGLADHLAARKGKPVFRLYQRWLRSVDRFVCYGYEERKKLLNLFQLPPSRVHFVPFGTDVAYFRTGTERPPRPEDMRPQTDAVLSVGMDAQRDWALLFRAAQRLPCRFEIVSNLAYSRDLEPPANVTLHPPMPVHEVRSCYERAPFVVLPVKENTYSAGTITLLQCMAMGKAVIVSQTGAIRGGYNLAHKDNCWLVRPGSVEDLTEAIRMLYNHPELRSEIGQRARRAVEARHTSNAFAKALRAIFEKETGEQ